MKKFCLFLLTWLLTGFSVLWADVATPNPIRMKQPDGSTITLRLHGDEFHSWYTDLNGKVYARGTDGWWRPSTQLAVSPGQREEVRRMRRLRDERFFPATKSQSGLGLGRGSNHFLVILVEFSDLKFQSGAESYFNRMLNAEGFTENGCVGSARDYWIDASSGQFAPSFDVYGPVTLRRKHTDFPQGDSDHHYELARTIVIEAMEQLDASSEIDFSQYDNDKDGIIDNVYMFYAGYAQSNGGGEDTIWPHAWSVRSTQSFDGVRASSYACSAELQGSDGAVFNGCGTFCHEFGHVIGLPDLYDTDYEENGEALDPSCWNLMAGGNHNGAGCIPAALSTYERYLLGYLNPFEDISSYGSKTLPSVTSNRGFILPTANEGEMFLLEVRDGKKWDSPLTAGLLVYHVDASGNMVEGMTAKQRWEEWDQINDFASHPCHYIIPPVDDAPHNKYFQLWVLPKDDYKYHNITETRPVSWSGLIPYTLKDIAYADGQATLTVAPGPRRLVGEVVSSASEITQGPVGGATVLVLPQVTTKSSSVQVAGLPPLTRSGRGLSLEQAKKEALYEARTDEDGRYVIELSDTDPESFIVAVYAVGYLAAEASVSGRNITSHFDLQPMITGTLPEFVTKCGMPVAKAHSYGYKDTGVSYSLAHAYEPAELKPYVGRKLSSISFSCAATGEEVYAFVDFGDTRVFVQRIQNPSGAVLALDGYFANVVDLSGEDLVIPADTDLVIGYIVKNANASYFMYTDDGPEQTYGFLVSDSVDPNKAPEWSAASLGVNLLIGFSLSTTPAFDDKATLSDMGFSYIELPAGELKAGASLPLKLVVSKARKPLSTAWYYDGKPVSDSAVTLTAGLHTVKAVVNFGADEPEDVIELQLEVK